jgi:tRNA modification GTPase
MCELHVHGARAVVAAVLDALGQVEGLTPARAGDFTRRAFDNGRIDLSQVEGLADLLAAETEVQRRSALLMTEGRLGQFVTQWRTALLQVSAKVEAALDFSDEGDVPEPEVSLDLAALAGQLQTWSDAPSAERLRDGVRVVLAGPPNAGKSTLLNAMAQREAAITSPTAGTTRDLLDVPIALEGLPFVITDTAGLHDADMNAVEEEGIRRAHAAMARADIILWLGEASACPDPARAVLIAARADERRRLPAGALPVSAKTGQGVAALTALLLARARHLLPQPDGVAVNERQRRLIRACLTELTAAAGADDLLIVAEHLRVARTHLDHLVGQAGVEHVLDALFSGFCIGK